MLIYSVIHNFFQASNYVYVSQCFSVRKIKNFSLECNWPKHLSKINSAVKKIFWNVTFFYWCISHLERISRNTSSGRAVLTLFPAQPKFHILHEVCPKKTLLCSFGDWREIAQETVEVRDLCSNPLFGLSKLHLPP